MRIPVLPPIPRHTHRADFNALAVSGVVVVEYPGTADPPRIGPLVPTRFDSGAVGWKTGKKRFYVQVGEQWLLCETAIAVRVVNSRNWPEA